MSILNDSFIDSINILKTDKLVNKIIDSIFGSITVDLNKTEKQLEEEAKINQIIDRFINLDENYPFLIYVLIDNILKGCPFN